MADTASTRRKTAETPRLVVSAHDHTLQARIVRRVPMHYAGGADPDTDRPAYVRAASSMAWAGTRVAMVQDDVNFVALVDPATGLAHAVTLPAGKDGLRQFDDGRGNKKHRLDMEALARVPSPGGTMLIAFGSGSKKRRENVVTLRFSGRDHDPDATEATLAAMPDLYAALRAESHFAGSQMNIEGALYHDGVIRLFGRSNGEAKDDLHPLDATCDLNWQGLQAHLRDPRSDTLPVIQRITQYELGEIDGVGLGFTDAIRAGRASAIYTAAAEASKNADSDGDVGGSVLGVLPDDRRQPARWTHLLDEAGKPFAGKVEGLVLDRRDSSRAFVVVDVDDHSRPSELCEVMLAGSWPTR